MYIFIVLYVELSHNKENCCLFLAVTFVFEYAWFVVICEAFKFIINDKIVAKIIRTLMLRRFCNPSCTTYRGTGSVINIMICDHGVYHDTWSYFVILWPLLQPQVARKVAKRDGFCNLLQLTCDEKQVYTNFFLLLQIFMGITPTSD